MNAAKVVGLLLVIVGVIALLYSGEIGRAHV